MKKKTTSTDARPRSAAIHLTETIYPVAVGVVKQFARQEKRSLAQSAAILIERAGLAAGYPASTPLDPDSAGGSSMNWRDK